MKKLIATVVTAGLLVAGTAGLAGAASSPGPKPEAKAGVEAADHTGLRGRRALAGLKVAATSIGIEPKALVQALKDGQSVADVARSHDVDPQTVIDAVVTAGNTKIDAAVTAGTLTTERAATMKDKLPKAVARLVNGKLGPRAKQHIKRATVRRHARRGGAIVAAKTIGIEPKALAEAVRSGQSVADVARSHDVDPQTVIDAVVTAGNTKIDAAVTAGTLTTERAATMKDKLPKAVARLVNLTPRDRSDAAS